MASKLKSALLTAEERTKAGFGNDVDYAVQFTNKSGEVLYVSMRETLAHDMDDDYSRRVDFKLYDSGLQCLEETSTHDWERGGYVLSISQALKKSSDIVDGEGKELYAKAAQMAADMERKKEELKQKQTIAEQKEQREKSLAFQAVRNFFNR